MHQHFYTSAANASFTSSLPYYSHFSVASKRFFHLLSAVLRIPLCRSAVSYFCRYASASFTSLPFLCRYAVSASFTSSLPLLCRYAVNASFTSSLPLLCRYAVSASFTSSLPLLCRYAVNASFTSSLPLCYVVYVRVAFLLAPCPRLLLPRRSFIASLLYGRCLNSLRCSFSVLFNSIIQGNSNNSCSFQYS